MDMKKIVFLVLAALIFSGYASAAEHLTQQEAINHFNDGVKLEQKGNYGAAAALYQKAVYLEPGPELKKLALNNLGAMLAKEEDFEGAEAAFRQAIQIDPKYRSALANLGYLYYLRGDEDSALKFLMRAEGLKEGKSDFVTEEKQGKF